MIICESSTPYDLKTVCGEVMVPADRDSAHAVYTRDGRSCGVTYESGSSLPYLRCNPGYQLPHYARDKERWKRFVWECEDERALAIRMDARDGELCYICHDEGIADNLDAKVEECLSFLLGDAFFGELVGYVRSFEA